MQELIKRLDLKPTNIQIGETFVNNITVYSLFNEFLIAECNSLGEPTPDKCIVWHKYNPPRYGYFYLDFLMDIPVSEIYNLLFNRIAVNN